MSEKLVVVLRTRPDALLDDDLSPTAATRFEVDLAADYPESAHYPSRDEVVATVLVSAPAVDEVLFAETVAACGGLPAVVAAYRLEERPQWDYERTWEGARTPGMKQISFISKAPGLSRDAFARHWRETHARLAAAHHPTIWRYVQNVLVESLTADAPAIDGVAELSYRSHEDWRDRKYDSPDGREVIAADIATFMDAPASWHLLAHEHVLG